MQKDIQKRLSESIAIREKLIDLGITSDVDPLFEKFMKKMNSFIRDGISDSGKIVLGI